MILPHIPYTYLIGWSIMGLYYYGVRHAVGCHPSDLFVSYFTSSAYVAQCIADYGEPDVIQIRQCFDSKEAAVKWEHSVIRRLNAHKSEKWLNKCSFPNIINDFTEEYRKKLSVARKKRITKEETKAKISASMKGKTKGRPRSNATKEKLSKALKGRPWSTARRSAHINAVRPDAIKVRS